MKYLFSFSVPLLLFGVFYFGGNHVDSNTCDSYKSFSEFYFHHSCSGSSGIGGTCSATCRDKCDCSCSTGFFTCICNCNCPDDPTTSIEFEIAPEEKWNLLKEIIATENSEIAKEMLTAISELYDLGIRKKIKEYNALAKSLDQKMMKLQPATLDKILTAFI